MKRRRTNLSKEEINIVHTILFLIQNETHAMNAAALEKEFADAERHDVRTIFLCLDEIMHLETKKFLPNEFILHTTLRALKPFYRMNRISQVVWLIRNKSVLIREIKDVDMLVIGCDGAIQRLIANIVYKQGGKVVMILDGIISPWSDLWHIRLIRQLKRMLWRVGSFFNLEFLTPSFLGHSRLDLILVMDSSVKNELKRQCVKTPVQEIILPRFKTLIDQVIIARSLQKKQGMYFSSKRILYATSAFQWHGLTKLNNAQLMDIKALLKFAGYNPEIFIRIRVHPREDKRLYSKIDLPSNVEITYSSLPLHEDLAWATMVVTGRSSVLFEAGLLGLKCFVSTQNFPVVDDMSYLANAKHIKFIRSFDELISTHSPIDKIEDILNLDQPYPAEIILRMLS